MRTSLFRNLRKYLVVTLAIFVISGCGSADVDISCSEYFAEAPSAYQEKAPGILHDPETDLLWFRCNLGQRYENGRCVGDAANKNFAATLSDIAETYYWSSTEGKNDTYACATRLKDGLRTCQTKKTTLNPTLLVANAD
jgi:hypothetical protein